VIGFVSYSWTNSGIHIKSMKNLVHTEASIAPRRIGVLPSCKHIFGNVDLLKSAIIFSLEGRGRTSVLPLHRQQGNNSMVITRKL